jgi:hypothetical protein
LNLNLNLQFPFEKVFKFYSLQALVIFYVYFLDENLILVHCEIQIEQQGLSTAAAAAAAAAVKSESIIRSVEHGSGIMAMGLALCRAHFLLLLLSVSAV